MTVAESNTIVEPVSAAAAHDVSPQEIPTPASPPVAEVRQRRSPWWTILLLTILAGVLRFGFVEKPPLWGDDAATWSRICGSYSQMLGALEDAGFGPLHYELYWWIKSGLPVWFKTEVVPSDPLSGRMRRRAGPAIRRDAGPLPPKTELKPVARLMPGEVTMTPRMMRLVPAIAGTLMVPAMYWLASQLVNRRAALLAAVFVAFSAYMLNYSRDAKMYMPLWLMCTVHVACLLWWLRVRTRHAWYCWVASGIAMVGLQTVGFGVLGVEVLILLTARRQHWRSLGKLLMLIPWLPMVLLTAVGSPLLTLARADVVSDRGLVARFFQRRFERFAWPPVVFFLLGALVIGSGSYGYYKHFCVFFEDVLPDTPAGSVVVREAGIGWVDEYNAGRNGFDLARFTASAYLYNWEWPRFAPGIGINDVREINVRTYRLLYTAGLVLSGVLAAGLLPWPRRWVGALGTAVADRSWWRTTFRLAAWLAVPAYAFYCASIDDFLSPFDVLAQAFLVKPVSAHWPHALPWHGGAELLGGLKSSIVAYVQGWHAENIRWWLVVPVAAAAVVGAALAGNRWKSRLARFLLGCAVAGGVVMICEVVYLVFNRPFTGSVWMPRYLGFTFPAFAIVVAVLLSRLPTRWVRWPAVGLLVLVNLSVFAARVFAGTEPPIDRIAKDVILDRDDATVATYYVSVGAAGVTPGSGSLNGAGGTTQIARYYLATLSNRPTSPAETRGGRRNEFNAGFQIRQYLPFGANLRILNEVKSQPKLRRLIVWDRLNTGVVDLTDPVGDALAPDWRRVSETIDQARDHWTWREQSVGRGEYYQYRRREYVRVTGPTTRP